MEERLNTMRANHMTKRDIAIAVSCQGFYKTGLMTDIVQVTFISITVRKTCLVFF